MKKMAYYITAHGYGHGTRSCDIICALHAAAPGIPILVKTDLPLAFMQSRLPSAIKIMRGAFDTGLVQKDSIQVDLEASLHAVEELYAHEKALIAQELDFIERENIGLVVADIPAIPLEAARRANVPTIATGNFGWDWIYSDFVRHDSRWQTYVEKFRSAYRQTDLLLRQPFAEPMAAFPRQADLPLLAKPGINRREELAAHTGADPAKKWVLLSFTTLNLAQPALERLSYFMKYDIFTVEPLEWKDSGIHCISRSTASFADALASVDVVVTKPGFGIISECIANDKPIIYADRENFLEYPVLVEGIERYCQNVFIPAADLYSGNLAPALEAIETAPAPTETMPRGGAEIAAQKILGKIAV
jgi:L-arabinokinase